MDAQTDVSEITALLEGSDPLRGVRRASRALADGRLDILGPDLVSPLVSAAPALLGDAFDAAPAHPVLVAALERGLAPRMIAIETRADVGAGQREPAEAPADEAPLLTCLRAVCARCNAREVLLMLLEALVVFETPAQQALVVWALGTLLEGLVSTPNSRRQREMVDRALDAVLDPSKPPVVVARAAAHFVLRAPKTLASHRAALRMLGSQCAAAEVDPTGDLLIEMARALPVPENRRHWLEFGWSQTNAEPAVLQGASWIAFSRLVRGFNEPRERAPNPADISPFSQTHVLRSCAIYVKTLLEHPDGGVAPQRGRLFLETLVSRMPKGAYTDPEVTRFGLDAMVLSLTGFMASHPEQAERSQTHTVFQALLSALAAEPRFRLVHGILERSPFDPVRSIAIKRFKDDLATDGIVPTRLESILDKALLRADQSAAENQARIERPESVLTALNLLRFALLVDRDGAALDRDALVQKYVVPTQREAGRSVDALLRPHTNEEGMEVDPTLIRVLQTICFIGDTILDDGQG